VSEVPRVLALRPPRGAPTSLQLFHHLMPPGCSQTKLTKLAMSLNRDDSDDAVAYLVFIRNDDPGAFHDRPVAANEQFDIGRAHVNEYLNVHDQCISNSHVRFHCVMYGDDEDEHVPPLVYVRVLSSHGISLTRNVSAGINTAMHIGKDHADILLCDGDVIELTRTVRIEYSANDPSQTAPSLGRVQQAEVQQFALQYTVTPRKLGAGGFAKVHLAIETTSRRQVACKIVRLPARPSFPSTGDQQALQQHLKKSIAEHAEEQKYHRKRCSDLRRECEILQSLDHPNIIKFEKAFYAPEHVYIFQELITGGDLLSYMEKKQGVKEAVATTIVYQLLKALEFLHQRGIVHRDIKPENVLMTSWRDGARVVLTDFGQSRTVQDAKNAVEGSASVARMRTLVGTHGYCAPYVSSVTLPHTAHCCLLTYNAEKSTRA
jgi:tRNA A-37 threonylcarbamoyl transferase component Bud32